MLKDRNKRRKATIKDKCFNYYRIKYFRRDCTALNSQLPKKKAEDVPNYY